MTDPIRPAPRPDAAALPPGQVLAGYFITPERFTELRHVLRVCPLPELAAILDAIEADPITEDQDAAA